MRYKNKVIKSIVGVTLLTNTFSSMSVFAEMSKSEDEDAFSLKQEDIITSYYIKVETVEEFIKVLKDQNENTFIHIHSGLISDLNLEEITIGNMELEELLLNYQISLNEKPVDTYSDLIISVDTSIGMSIINNSKYIDEISLTFSEYDNSVNPFELLEEDEVDNLEVQDDVEEREVVEETEEQEKSEVREEIEETQEIEEAEDSEDSEELEVNDELADTEETFDATNEDSENLEDESEETNEEAESNKELPESEVDLTEIIEDDSEIEDTLMNDFSTSFSMFSTNSVSTDEDTVIYTVKSGDTLSRIASLYGVTVNNIVEWNNIANANSISVGQKLTIYLPKPYDPDPDNELVDRESPFTSNQDFVNYVSQQASIVAPQNGLYSSVMIAQAILETGYGSSSLSKPPYYNLFGIKTTANDPNHVYMRTAEQDKDGNEFFIYAYFKNYDNYAESFRSNATRLRTGTTSNPSFYSGAWTENTDSYRDATLWLQGRYATDVEYAAKLNRVISQWNLTQYDTFNKVNSEFETVYSAEVNLTNTNAIYNTPPLTHNFSTATTTKKLSNKNVIIRKALRTDKDTWYQIEQNGKSLGWINAKHIKINHESILQTYDVNYNAVVNSNRFGIFSKPAYTTDNKKVNDSANFLNQSVRVLKESTTSKRTWVLVAQNGKEIGWVNKDALSVSVAIAERQTVAYNGTTISNNNIYSHPAYQAGFEIVSNTNSIQGQRVTARETVTTTAGEKWVLIERNGTEIGWVRQNVLNPQYNTVSSAKTVAYNARMVTDGRYQIFSQPAYTENNQKVADSSSYQGDRMVVREERVLNNNTTWILLERNGEEIGWMNKNAIESEFVSVSSEKTVAYNASVNTDGRFQIFSQPAYTANSYQVADSRDYLSGNVIVRKERTLRNGAVWALIERGGKEIGWINKSAILANYSKVTIDRTVAYDATMSSDGRFQVFSQPAYTQNNHQVINAETLKGQDVIIRQEKVIDQGSTWVLIELNGTNLGWINKNGISPNYEGISSQRSVNYNATVITDGRFQVFSRPAYTKDNHQVYDSSRLTNQVVKVNEEITTSKGRTWAFISLNGSDLGWINIDSLKR